MNMSKDTFILSEWEKDKMDRLKELARLEDAKIEGHEAGYSEGHSSGYSEGHSSGYSDGKNEGKIEGKIEGKLEGKLESKIEIAKNFLSKNIAKEIISECTGLTIEELEQLKD